jgi:hypothetical protein
LGESVNRPLVRGLSPAELQAFIEDTLDERLPFYAQAKIEVDPIAMTPDELIKKLVHA